MNKPESTENKQDQRFKPGQSGNLAGRPKGSRNKLGEAFLDSLCDDFDKFGIEVIERVRLEHPSTYLKVVAKLLPQQLQIDAKVGVQTLSDEQLKLKILQLQKQVQISPVPLEAEYKDVTPKVVTKKHLSQTKQE